MSTCGPRNRNASQAMVLDILSKPTSSLRNRVLGNVTSRAPRGPGRGPPCRRVLPWAIFGVSKTLLAKTALPRSSHKHTHTHVVQVSTGQPSQRPLVLQQPAARKATHHEEPSQKALARTPEALRLPGSGLSSPADVKAATESATSVTVLLLAISPFLTSDGPAAW